MSQRNFPLSQPDEAEVSWQSIFWALVPLALSTMVQPTGQTLGLSKRYTLMLRSSPIICVVDCAVALVALIRYIWQGSSVSTAIGQLMVSRFQRSTGTTVRENSLSALLQNRWLRIFLFAGGTLPQTVKLCGLQGVPWAKALASMYLIPFLIFELIAFIGRRNQDQVLPQDSLSARPIHHDVLIPVARISGCLAITVQMGLWYYMVSYSITYRISAEYFEPSKADIWYFLWKCIWLLPYQLLPLTPFPCAIAHFFRIDATPAVQSAIKYIRILLFLAITLLYGVFLYAATCSNGYMRVLCFYIMLPIIVLGLWTIIWFELFLLSPCLTLGRYRIGQSSFCHWLAWHFLVSNVVFTCSYYFLAWDPRGTVAPGWTTYLG